MVGVGVFPEGEEGFVGGERPDVGGIGIRALSLAIPGIRDPSTGRRPMRFHSLL
jgi:hypothetical protein